MKELRRQMVEPAALRIQSFIRGYLGRGLVKDMYRRRLLQTLQIWAHGKTSNLLDRPFIKTAMINGKDCTIWVDLAIHVSRTPSRPLKNLYSAKDVKDIMKIIEEIRKQEKGKAEIMKREYSMRILDRENMLKADKESTFIQAWE